MNRVLRSVILLIVSAGMVASLNVEPTSGSHDARIAWLEEHVVPLIGCEADEGFSDLEPLREMIGDARIVGLGESTHGTREHFLMKHRLLEYLDEELGFTWFAIEASTPDAHRLDAYVLGGAGDPAALIGGMYFWTWNTEEVLAMVEWMRAYNARSDRKIHFTGFDMQTPDVATEEVMRFLVSVESPLAAAAAVQYPRIMAASNDSTMAYAAYSFPLAEARGKMIRFRAWIKTEELRGGRAGLWGWVGGVGGKLLAADDTMYSGPIGNTDWAEYVIELPVAAEATSVNFGFSMTGEGRAWFDAASIELNNVAYDASSFDLGFEGDRIAAYRYTDDTNYTSELDGSVAYAGGQSLRIASVPKAPDAPTAREALVRAEAILSKMEAARGEWLTLRPVEEVERAILYARIVTQCMRMRAADDQIKFRVRDEAMAENVTWLAEQNPEARIVLWAHNGHVNRAPDAMGSNLAARFGDAYLPVGFATAEGSYAAKSSSVLEVHDLQTPPEDSFEAVFAAAEAPLFALDLRPARPGDEGSGWLCETRPFRGIGSGPMDEQFSPTPLREYFDLVIFVEETTAARQLPTPPSPSP